MPPIGAILWRGIQNTYSFRVTRIPPPSPWLLILLLLLNTPLVTGSARAGDDAPLKAHFLLNLTRFVDWPTSAFDSAESSFLACTMDATSVQASLESLVANRKFKGRNIEVREVEDLENAKTCHLFYNGATSQQKLHATSATLIGKPVLSVAESEKFALWGGVVGIKVIRGKLAISINRVSAERAGLKVSAQLLKIATVID